MELNRCRDCVADEIGKSSDELEASNAACQACLEEAGKHMRDDKANDPRVIELWIFQLLQADTAQTTHAVHVLSPHLCAVKANKVEEDIQLATKAKQTKNTINGEVFDVSFLSSLFWDHSFPVT